MDHTSKSVMQLPGTCLASCTGCEAGLARCSKSMSYLDYILQPSNVSVLGIALITFLIGCFMQFDEGGMLLMIIGAGLLFLQLGLHYENWRKKYPKQDKR